MTIPSLLIKLGLAVTALCVIAFGLGMVLQAAIPGCRCDEGAGCSPCAGFGGLISLMTFGGFVGLIVALPSAAVLAILASVFGFGEVAVVQPQVLLALPDVNITLAALDDYRTGCPVTAHCEVCGSVLTVEPVAAKLESRSRTVAVHCDCGQYKGRYQLDQHDA